MEGCSEGVGVADGGQCEGGGFVRVWVGLGGGLSGSCASTSMYGPSWPGLVGLGGAWWSRASEVGLRVSWVLVAGGCCGVWPSGVLRWRLGGLWTEIGGVCGVRSSLVDFYVMHGMVMDETQQVFPGNGVG